MKNTYNINDEQSLENAMAQLEEIVKKLEEGNSTLDDTLKLYEDGIKLYRYCNGKIQNAEHKITIMQNNIEMPFNTELGDED